MSLTLNLNGPAANHVWLLEGRRGFHSGEVLASWPWNLPATQAGLAGLAGRMASPEVQI